MNADEEISIVIVVSEQSVPTLKAQIGEQQPATEFHFCTKDEDVEGILLMLTMIPVKEVLVVGPLNKNSIAKVETYAIDNKLPIRTWQKETVH